MAPGAQLPRSAQQTLVNRKLSFLEELQAKAAKRNTKLLGSNVPYAIAGSVEELDIAAFKKVIAEEQAEAAAAEAAAELAAAATATASDSQAAAAAAPSVDE